MFKNTRNIEPSTIFTDGQTQYNAAPGKWELDVISLGGSFIEVLLDLHWGSNFPNINNVTYDTLVEWISEGWNLYNNVLMTNWSDLTPFKKAGGKVIHYHGESDYSSPTASSVRSRKTYSRNFKIKQDYPSLALAKQRHTELSRVSAAGGQGRS
jgi:hypothetical protein